MKWWEANFPLRSLLLKCMKTDANLILNHDYLLDHSDWAQRMLNSPGILMCICSYVICRQWLQIPEKMDTFSYVPPGFRFHPTEEELVDYYLRKKVAASRGIDLDIIKDVDLYKIEPWDLQGIYRLHQQYVSLFIFWIGVTLVCVFWDQIDAR